MLEACIMNMLNEYVYLLSCASFCHSTHNNPDIIAVTDLRESQRLCCFVWCQPQPAEGHIS